MSVTRLPLVGRVKLVDAVVVNVNGKLPLVTKFPPKVIVELPLFTPVPPKLALTGTDNAMVPLPVIVPPVKPVPAVTLVTVPVVGVAQSAAVPLVAVNT